VHVLVCIAVRNYAMIFPATGCLVHSFIHYEDFYRAPPFKVTTQESSRAQLKKESILVSIERVRGNPSEQK